MAVSYVGGSVGTDALPAHQVGDLILVFGFRDGSTTAPGTLSGYTGVHASGANTCSMRLQWKIATSTSESSPAMSNASCHVRMVFRGTHPSTPIGNFLQRGGSNTTVVYDAVTCSGDGRGAFVGFCGHRSINTALETPPTGMVAGPNHLNATAEAVGHYQLWNRDVDWPETSVAVGGTSSGFRGIVVELMPADKVIGELIWWKVFEDSSGSGLDDFFTSTDAPVAASGDLALVAFATQDNTPGSPSGWSSLWQRAFTGFVGNLHLYYKNLTSSDVTFSSVISSGDETVAVLLVFHKCELASSSTSGISNGSSGSADPPAVSFDSGGKTKTTVAIGGVVNTVRESPTPPSGFSLICSGWAGDGSVGFNLAAAYIEGTDTIVDPGTFGGYSSAAWVAATVSFIHGIPYVGTVTAPVLSFATAALSFFGKYSAVLSAPAFSLTAPAVTYIAEYGATVTFETFEFSTNPLTYSVGYRFTADTPSFPISSFDLSWVGEFGWEVSSLEFSIETFDLSYSLITVWRATLAEFPFVAYPFGTIFPWKPVAPGDGTWGEGGDDELTWTEGVAAAGAWTEAGAETDDWTFESPSSAGWTIH